MGVGIIVKQRNRMQRAPSTLSDFTLQEGVMKLAFS